MKLKTLKDFETRIKHKFSGCRGHKAIEMEGIKWIAEPFLKQEAIKWVKELKDENNTCFCLDCMKGYDNDTIYCPINKNHFQVSSTVVGYMENDHLEELSYLLQVFFNLKESEINE